MLFPSIHVNKANNTLKSHANLSFEERRVSAEGSGQDVVIHLVAEITAEYTEII